MLSNPRRKHRNLAAICLALAFSGPSANAQASEPALSAVPLEWSAVEGARSYEVTVRAADGGATIFSATVEANRVDAALPAGAWEIRVRALNVFGRPLSEGAWTSFTVRRTARLESPRLEPAPKARAAESGTLTLDLSAEGLIDETRIYLEGSSGAIEPSAVRRASGRLSADFPTQGMSEGEYDVVLENPGGIVARIEGAWAYEEPTSVSAALPTEALPPKEPPIVAAPPIELAVVPAVEPAQPEESPETTLPDVPDPVESPRVPGGPIFDLRISGAWYPSFLLTEEWTVGYGPALAGLELALAVSLGEGASGSSLLRSFAIELCADGAWYPGLVGDVIDEAYFLTAGFGGRLRFDWKPFTALGLRLGLRAGGGYAISAVERSGQVGAFSGVSGDYFASGGLALSWDFDTLRLSTGADFRRTFYLGVSADTLRPYLGLGVRL